MRSNSPARAAATAVASPAPRVGWIVTSQSAASASCTAASLLFSRPLPAWVL